MWIIGMCAVGLAVIGNAVYWLVFAEGSLDEEQIKEEQPFSL